MFILKNDQILFWYCVCVCVCAGAYKNASYSRQRGALLGVVVAAGHFHEFHLAVEGHPLDSVSRRVFDLRDLLARVGIDDFAGIHSQRLDQLNLRLKRDVWKVWAGAWDITRPSGKTFVGCDGVLCLRSRSPFPERPASSVQTDCRCIWRRRTE